MGKPKFDYSEIDIEGLDTLKVISQTDKFNNWIYQSIKPSLKGNILEIGSGIGNITACLINDKLNITASDLRANYNIILKERLGQYSYLQGIRKIDIMHPDFDNEYKDLLDTFDTVFAINIIEHIENDHLAIKNCRKLLLNHGNLIILVPAYQALYNRFDKELKHFRRYSKAELKAFMLSENLKINHIRYFNFMGILGWWFSGSILKKKTIPAGQMKLFNFLVPVFKVIDKITGNRIGLSLIISATK